MSDKTLNAPVRVVLVSKIKIDTFCYTFVELIFMEVYYLKSVKSDIILGFTSDSISLISSIAPSLLRLPNDSMKSSSNVIDTGVKASSENVEW